MCLNDGDWQNKVEAILKKAFTQGRRQLYEQEVYQILASLDISTPRWEFLTKTEEITRDLLSRFTGSRVVLKAVSPKAPHKEKIGGVKILKKDIQKLRLSFAEMRKTLEDQDIPMTGVLITAFVDYSPELGNEVLLGFRESDTFGPVLSCGKGGSDAEFFASHFSAPGLLLAPIDREETRRFLSSTKFGKNLLRRHREDCLNRLAEAQVKLGRLAAAYSQFFESPSEFVLKEFEINPFVFCPASGLIALDGYAVFDKKKIAHRTTSQRNPKGLFAFFKPQGVAVVGVSSNDHTKVGNVIISNLTRLGRKDLFCLNPRGGKVEEAGVVYPLYPSLEALPRTPELVVVTVPAERTLPEVRKAADIGVKGILLIPGGFSEFSGSQDIEEEIQKIARKAGIRILGPNCLGVIAAGCDGTPGMNTFFIPEKKFKLNLTARGGLALFTQSGALGLTQLSFLENAITPHVVVSYGNQLDIDPSDLVDYFREDPNVRVMGLYIEGFKEAGGRRFFDLARKTAKPILVYKAGRTQAGRLAAQSHTAALAGEYAVAEAALNQAGLVVANSLEDYLGMVKLFALQDNKEVAGGRIAMVTNAGYEKTNAADNLRSLSLAALSEETTASLKKNLPSFVVVDPLLDMTPMSSDEDYIACTDTLLGAPEVDALCVSIVPHAGLIHTTDEEIGGFEKNIARGIVDTAARHHKPLVVSIPVSPGGNSNYNRLVEVLEKGGVPVYRSVERAMVCLDAFVQHHLAKGTPPRKTGDRRLKGKPGFPSSSDLV